MELTVKNLGFQYVRGKDIFHDVSFSLQEGDILSILGTNGAGKSTLLNCLAGLSSASRGEIRLDGAALSAMSRNEIAQLVGYVPQLHENSFFYSVLEYTVMGRAPYISAYGTPSKADYAIARESLAQVGMGGKEDKIITEMSGGEQQLVMIARVLAQKPKLILLDEPTNHLDYGNQYRTLELLRQLAAEGYIVITTTHNPDHVFALGGKAGILIPGQNIRIGNAEQVLTAESLSALYRSDISVIYSKEAGRNICFLKNKWIDPLRSAPYAKVMQNPCRP